MTVWERYKQVLLPTGQNRHYIRHAVGAPNILSHYRKLSFQFEGDRIQVEIFNWRLVSRLRMGLAEGTF
jgi:hypothetical protein